MKYISFFFISIAALAWASCNKMSKYYDFRLQLENKTGKNVVAYYDYDYPDTSLPSEFPKSINANYWFTGQGGVITFKRGGSWETAFKEQMPSGKLMLFVLDKAVVDNNPWDSVRQRYAVLKRFDLTIDTLKALDFKLTIN